MLQDTTVQVKGYFIPIHVTIHSNLRPIDCLLFGLIESLDGVDGCFARYGYLAARLGVPLSTINRALDRLIDAGFIKKEKSSKSRKRRVIRVRESYRTRYEGAVRRWLRGLESYKNGDRGWSKEVGSYKVRKPLFDRCQNDIDPVVDHSGEDPESMSKCNLKDVKMTSKPQTIDVKMTSIYNTNSVLKQREKTTQRDPAVAITRNSHSTHGGFTSEIQREAESRKERKQELRYDKASPLAREVVDAWNEMGCGVHHFVTSSSVEKALYVIENKVLTKYSIERVYDALRTFKKQMKSPKTYGLVDRKRSIEEFFVSSHYLRKHAMRKGWEVPRPLFWLLIDEESMKRAHGASSEVVAVAGKIRSYWLKAVLAEPDLGFTGKQEMDFIEAAERVIEYKNRKRLSRYFADPTTDDYIDVLFRALANRFGPTGFVTGSLKSSYTWTDVVPKYLTSVFKG